MALWRIEEAAEYLGIRPKTLYEWVRTDRIPYRKLGFNVRFDPDELEAWVRDQPAGGRRGRKKASRAKSADKESAPSPGTAELAAVALEATRQLRRVESDLGASLSFPQRQELRDLAKRLEKAARAVEP